MDRRTSAANSGNDRSMPQHIERLIDAELAGSEDCADFVADRVRPRPITVNFSGGITQTCWTVTRGDGDYQVVYLPTADYFALVVKSDLGPLDIGVHGAALGVHGSV